MISQLLFGCIGTQATDEIEPTQLAINVRFAPQTAGGPSAHDPDCSDNYTDALLSLRYVRLSELYGGDPADRSSQPDSRDPDWISPVKTT